MAYPSVHACNLAQMFGHICTATYVTVGEMLISEGNGWQNEVIVRFRRLSFGNTASPLRASKFCYKSTFHFRSTCVSPICT